MMSDDSETVEDTKKVEVTDDSCTLEFIEIVPLDRPSDVYHTSEFIYPVVEVNPEDLQWLKQEPADENDNGDPHYYVKQKTAEFIHPVVEVKPEDLQEMKQEPADEYETEGPCFTVQVSSVCTYSTDCLQ